jgi:hypothetical protein
MKGHDVKHFSSTNIQLSRGVERRPHNPDDPDSIIAGLYEVPSEGIEGMTMLSPPSPPCPSPTSPSMLVDISSEEIRGDTNVEDRGFLESSPLFSVSV